MNTLTHESKTGNPVLEPATKAFLDALAAQGGTPIYQLPVEAARAVLTSAQSGDVSKPDADIEDRILPIGPSGRVAIRIVRPKGSKEMLPAVLYFHGGGWVLGDRNTHDRLIRQIAVGANVGVVFVDYSRSPEAKFPIAIEEAYAATQWVAENGLELGLDPKRLAVAGDSAGGNLAIAVTLLARERRGPSIAIQALFYPVTDANFDTASYLQFAEGHFLDRKGMNWFWDSYAPEAARRGVTASPLSATSDQLRGLPTALVITGECDVLRDEGEAYARKLVDAGVEVTAMRFMGTIHDFMMLNALASTPASKGAIMLATAFIRSAFTA